MISHSLKIKYAFLLCFKKNVLLSTFIDKKITDSKDSNDNKDNSLLLLIKPKKYVINRSSLLIKDLIPNEIHFSFEKALKTGQREMRSETPSYGGW